MKINFYLLALIFVLSLTPLLWFKPNTLISSVDVNQTFFPNERFIDRTYLWYPKVAGGSDRANDIGSLPVFIRFTYRLAAKKIFIENGSFPFTFYRLYRSTYRYPAATHDDNVRYAAFLFYLS